MTILTILTLNGASATKIAGAGRGTANGKIGRFASGEVANGENEPVVGAATDRAAIRNAEFVANLFKFDVQIENGFHIFEEKTDR